MNEDKYKKLEKILEPHRIVVVQGAVQIDIAT